MTKDRFRTITAAEDSDLVARAAKRIGGEWPEFMLHDPVAVHFDDCYDKLPDYQFVIVAADDSEPLAIGNSIPLVWTDGLENLPDTGWDWAMTEGIELNRSRRPANKLCALQIVVFGENRGRGLSRIAVEAMKKIGRERGLEGLMAPVRPSRKCEYPLTPIDRYIRWTDSDNRPFDPWLRVHYNLGARIIKPCPNAMTIAGTIAEWEKWTELRFPESGEYIVPGALVPVKIDIASDTGTYIEPNVWMYHTLGQGCPDFRGV